MAKRSKWQEWEMNLIKERFTELGGAGLKDLIPNHTQGSIMKKAYSLGLTCDVTKQRLALGIKKHNTPKGVVTGRNGYLYITLEDKTRVPLHRHVLEQSIGRKLLVTEIVHHKDGNKHNNSLENLEILSRSEHAKLHYSPKKLGKI